MVRELEKLRDAGSIGAPLDAEVDMYCAPDEYARFNALGEELRFLFITSEARVHEVSDAAGQRRARDQHRPRRGVDRARSLRATRSVSAAGSGVPDVGRYAEHPELCGRCVTNVDGPGEQRKFV